MTRMTSDEFNPANQPCNCADCRKFRRMKEKASDVFFYITVIVLGLIAMAIIAGSMVYGQEPITTQSIDYTNIPIPLYPKNPIPVTINRIHDADTITDCTIHLQFDIDLPHRSIRCYGFDAWEVSKVRDSLDAGPITDDEIVKGLKAKDALVAMLFNKNNGAYSENRLFVEPVKTKDPYGRYDCWWWVWEDGHWVNLAQWGKDNGHQRVKVKP